MNLGLANRYLKIITSYLLGYPFYPPDSVSIIITNSCNLKCMMCDFWKDIQPASGGLTLNELKALFDDLKGLGTRMVQLTGGEPFLRKDLVQILREAKGRGLETAAVTNGTLINDENAFDFASNCNLI